MASKRKSVEEKLRKAGLLEGANDIAKQIALAVVFDPERLKPREWQNAGPEVQTFLDARTTWRRLRAARRGGKESGEEKQARFDFAHEAHRLAEYAVEHFPDLDVAALLRAHDALGVRLIPARVPIDVEHAVHEAGFVAKQIAMRDGRTRQGKGKGRRPALDVFTNRKCLWIVRAIRLAGGALTRKALFLKAGHAQGAGVLHVPSESYMSHTLLNALRLAEVLDKPDGDTYALGPEAHRMK